MKKCIVFVKFQIRGKTILNCNKSMGVIGVLNIVIVWYMWDATGRLRVFFLVSRVSSGSDFFGYVHKISIHVLPGGSSAPP